MTHWHYNESYDYAMKKHEEKNGEPGDPLMLDKHDGKYKTLARKRYDEKQRRKKANCCTGCGRKLVSDE